MNQMEVRLLKKYFHVMLIEFKKTKEFALDFVGRLIYFPIKFLIIFFIWKYVFYNSPVTSIYTFDDIIGYYFILAIVELCITPCGYITYEEWQKINNGDLNLYLSKPLYYPTYAFFQKLGNFIFSIVMGMFFIYLIKILMGNFFNLTIQLNHIVLFLISLFLGFVIMFNLFLIVGHMTFWVENVLTLRDNLWNIIRIFSGQIFPISLYPQFLRNLSAALPFQYIYYMPISILQNKISETRILEYYIYQIIWVAILYLINQNLWKKGVSKYSAQGG